MHTKRSVAAAVLALLGLQAAPPLAAQQATTSERPALKLASRASWPKSPYPQRIDQLLRRGDWAAAEASARAWITEEVNDQGEDIPTLLAQLAVAEEGQGRHEDALWHWQVAQGMKWIPDVLRYGAPGQLLAGRSARRFDQAPSGVYVRREGDGAAPLTPTRKLSGEDARLPATYRSFPRGIQAQVIIDQHGQVREPVVMASTFPALTYLVLEAMRGWRFTPAQVGGEAVASFYELKVPRAEPLDQLGDFSKSVLAKPLEMLRAGRYADAQKNLKQTWAGALEDAQQTRAFLGMELLLQALADSGLGREAAAICRYHAAQTLEPRLYGADLSGFGAPGALLMRHPWVAPESECQPDDPGGGRRTSTVEIPADPEVVDRRYPIFPEYARRAGIQGKVVIESILTEAGAARDAVILLPGASAGLDAEALNTFCDWRFRPATLQGHPVKVLYSLTVSFEIRR